MKRVLLILIVLLAATGITAASGGYLNSDGYWQYSGDPYYWYGNNAYVRTLVNGTGYYSCGVYYPGASYYRYTYHHTYTAPVQLSYTDPGWRSKLLDIAAARDKAEASIRKAAFEQAYFKDAVQALGLTGNFRWDGYGIAPPYVYPSVVPYAGYGSLQLSTAGVNGSTVYGQTYNSIASVYGDANLSQLYQQASRLAENAQSLAGQATGDFGKLVGQEGSNRAKVAEILARSQAAMEFLKSLEQPGSKFESREFRFKVVPGTNGGMQIQKLDPTAPQAPVMPQVNDTKALEQSALKCISCHGPDKKDGGFDVRTYLTLSPADKVKVVQRLLTTDESKRMPRVPGGGVGPKMSMDEIRLWINN